MTELTIINQNGKLLANSRQVAEMIGKEHSHLMRDIRGYISILDPNPKLDSARFFIESTYLDSQQQARPCYLLTRKGCDMVANKMTGEKGVLFTATYVTRFEEMEQQLTQPQQLTRMQILEIAMAAEKQVVELQATITEQRPKVLLANSVTASKKSILIGELAKILKQNGIDIGQNRLFEWLRSKGYLGRKCGDNFNLPTQKAMEIGLFEIKKTAINHSDGIRIERTTKVTGKGQLYFVNKFLTKELAKI
ncbi:phage antirepressor KilAC domain-containing protein [Pelosinus baikalensis]|uniref:Phage antirepressor KilAC domain-containing protein n=1 Tax=Pelosinus baikalensis TaxID=2892015 RepID=A0ABS8HTY3_9FIRM|nr:phage antirepressor KilAC domain-containing protein [Pelosinus baikalensis]